MTTTVAKKTSELIAKLKKMAHQAGEALFERAGMALEVLDDAQWVADTFAGDKAKAEEVIAADCFPDLSMGGWFHRVLILRKQFSDLEQWRKFKFDLQRLWIDYQEKVTTKPPPNSDRKNPVSHKIYEEAVEEKKSAEYQLRRQKQETVNWQRRCEDLERDLRETRLELAEAQGRIKTLEMLVEMPRDLAVA